MQARNVPSVEHTWIPTSPVPHVHACKVPAEQESRLETTEPLHPASVTPVRAVMAANETSQGRRERSTPLAYQPSRRLAVARLDDTSRDLALPALLGADVRALGAAALPTVRALALRFLAARDALLEAALVPTAKRRGERQHGERQCERVPKG